MCVTCAILYDSWTPGVVSSSDRTIWWWYQTMPKIFINLTINKMPLNMTAGPRGLDRLRVFQSGGGTVILLYIKKLL